MTLKEFTFKVVFFKLSAGKHKSLSTPTQKCSQIPRDDASLLKLKILTH